jgi:lactoylglutathione lyase
MSLNCVSLGHIALRCKDVDAMRSFYVGQLGCEELFHLDNDDGSLWLTYIRTAQGQYVELFPIDYKGKNDAREFSPHHFCFEVDDFVGYVKLLREKGVEVYDGPYLYHGVMGAPEARAKGMCGSLCAFIKDPEGNDIEIMEFTPDSMQINCAKLK